MVRGLGLPQELRVEGFELRRSERRRVGREQAAEFSGRVDTHGIGRREGRMGRTKLPKVPRNLKLALPTASQSVSSTGTVLFLLIGLLCPILMARFVIFIGWWGVYRVH